jgi:tetratricopeptide (TPR) repeat protein
LSSHFYRGRLLYQQRNYKEAEAEFRKDILEDPDSSESHAMLGLTLCAAKRIDEALKEVRLAIQIAPESDYAHYAHAIILFNKEQYKLARDEIKEALRLSPEDCDYIALLSEIEVVEANYKDALAVAEAGLKIDAEDVGCINARSRALVCLGRTEEAGESLEFALSKDPENWLTHANLGWTLMRAGKTKEAFEAYRESLRLNPHSNYAREGVVEAMKARNPLYAFFLNAMYKLSTVGLPIRLGFIFLLIFFHAGGLIFLLMIIFWASNLMFNAVLSLDPFGKHALSQAELRSSRTFAIWVLTAGIAFGAIAIAKLPERVMIMTVIYFILMGLPLTRVWAVADPKKRILAWCYAFAVGIVGGAAVVSSILVHKEHAGAGLMGLMLLMALVFPFKMEEKV